MKKNKYSIYLSILLCLCFTSMRAQEKESVCSWVGAVWSYYDYDFEDYSYFRYTVLDRPEVIDELTYYPLVEYTTCEYEEGKEKAVCRIRQEGEKVYIRKEDFDNYSRFKDFIRFKEEGNDYILYDFSLNMGDEFCQRTTLEGNPVDTTIIFRVDTLQTDDKHSFRRMGIKAKNHKYYIDIWIGGVGSTYDLLVPFGHAMVDCSCYRTLNYFCSADSSVVYCNPRIKDVYDSRFGFYFDSSHYDHFKEDDCALNPSTIGEVADVSPFIIQANNGVVSCTSPNAVKLEVYTMDVVKVGESVFTNGEAMVKVGKTPATYLYIVTYPDGRRESGKAAIRN